MSEREKPQRGITHQHALLRNPRSHPAITVLTYASGVSTDTWTACRQPWPACNRCPPCSVSCMQQVSGSASVEGLEGVAHPTGPTEAGYVCPPPLSCSALRTQGPERAASADPGPRKAPAPGPRLQVRPSVRTNRPGRTGRPSRRAHNGAVVRTCRAMPRHIVVEMSRIAFSIKILLETPPVEAANSASSLRSANVGGPARPYVSWDRGTARHAPVPVRPYFSRFNASLASADTPVPQATAATVEDASG